MRLGNVTLTALSDGMAWEDGGGLFGLVPKALWQGVMAPDEQNRLPFELRCLLIETGQQRILVDTGCGDKISAEERMFRRPTGERRLLSSLATVGLTVEDIDLVVNTHLHRNHCGGNTIQVANGAAIPTFPRATYCVQRLELADAKYSNERTRSTYRCENWDSVERAGQLYVLLGDARLSDEVRVMVTPGHTRAHQCVVVESQGSTAIYLGDLASWPVHLERLAWVPAYDVEPLVSIETKRSLARWAIDRHALLIFDHHPTVVAGYLHATERADRCRLEPVGLV
jgi:glyoxylase-like metal-dependent hydrolase (beta-lactamase superfamily II)